MDCYLEVLWYLRGVCRHAACEHELVSLKNIRGRMFYACDTMRCRVVVADVRGQGDTHKLEEYERALLASIYQWKADYVLIASKHEARLLASAKNRCFWTPTQYLHCRSPAMHALYGILLSFRRDHLCEGGFGAHIPLDK